MLTSLSQVPLEDNCVLVFDLDDTLYSERDFLRSGFREIARSIDPNRIDEIQSFLELSWVNGNQDPISALLDRVESGCKKADLLKIYREHVPDIRLKNETYEFMKAAEKSQRSLGILTDGRSITQRNKLLALGISKSIDEVVISEEIGFSKPAEESYRHFHKVFPHRTFAYVGDNLAKDFVTPNRLGWVTVGMLDRGENIHAQDIDRFPGEYHPQYWISNIA